MEGSIKAICTVNLGMDHLENNYTFYNNGMIQHVYDESVINYNLMEWVQPGEISNYIKRRIIKNSPKRYKRVVMQILEFNLRMN